MGEPIFKQFTDTYSTLGNTVNACIFCQMNKMSSKQTHVNETCIPV